jgi:uncharacterized protein
LSLPSFFIAHFAGLGRRLNRVRRVEKLDLAMRDGVTLQTRHYAPATKVKHATILIRLPYGLTGFSTVARTYAERGFHVVLQACRGTGKSGGEFDPLVNERNDGLDTLDWIKRQPWFDGRLGTSGPSYLGYTQWAICDALPPGSAMVTQVTSAEFKSVVFPSGAFHLGLWLGWLQTIEVLRDSPASFSRRAYGGGIEKRTEQASMTFPLIEADIAAVGHKVYFWRKWFADALDNPAFWQSIDQTHRLGARTPPNHFISGWYDFMVDQLLRDYATLVEAGLQPYLTIGPWIHVSRDLQLLSLKETLHWMRAHLNGDWSAMRNKPVRIHVSGSNEWHEFDAFPPAPPDDQVWHLHGGNALAQRPARPAAPDHYRYDPADPTPNIGGAHFSFTNAGPMDNAARENRRDVVNYTSTPLPGPLTILGNVRVTLYARARFSHADFFLRLCDVNPNGTSINISDGLVRVTPDDPLSASGVWKLNIKLHATAHCFLPGHRLRLQVSSGAHPRFARNMGTGEPIGTASTLVANDIEVFHDPEHPALMVLPVYDLR